MNNHNDSILEKNAHEYDAHAQSWQASMSSNFGHKYLEKPAMEKELPDTFWGQAVLCIGVGSGEELQEILKRGPSQVVGIDISRELLGIAKSKFPKVEFQKMDMAAMDFSDATFDYIYSSLTFHYAPDWDTLCAEVFRVLKPGGELLFSTHHPGYWSQKTPTGNSSVNDRGVTLAEHTATLPGNVSIVYYNHPSTESICESVRHAGFKIKKSFSPAVVRMPLNSLSPTEAEGYNQIRNKNAESPLFFIVKAVKK